MEDNFRATVLDGNVVCHNRSTFAPGESFDCDESSMRKLLSRGVVELADLDFDDEPESDPLVAAIAALDPDRNNSEFWTKAGKPQVVALEKIVGVTVSGKDRNAAYTRFLNR